MTSSPVTATPTGTATADAPPVIPAPGPIDAALAVRDELRGDPVAWRPRSRRRPGVPATLVGIGPPSRRHLALVVILLGGLWLVLVVGGAASEAAVARAGAEEVRARIANIERRVQAARRELGLVRSVPFVQLGAREYGLGGPRERAFALAPGAPTPPPVPLLGREQERAAARAPSPMEEWLDLLFGP